MSSRTKIYWVVTVIAAVGLLFGGFANATLQEPVAKSMESLGYPAYFPRILGVWKILAAVALLAPRLPRAKEWATAGVAVALTGAAASHLANGDAVMTALPPLGLLALVIASYVLRPADRRLAGPVI